MHRRPGYKGAVTDEMREPTYLLLVALAGARQHGYGLMQEVSSLSDGRVRLQAGTLYGALERLSREGLVAGDGEETVNGRLRRFYVLSEAGLAVLQAQTARRKAALHAGTTRLRALGVLA